MKPKLASFIKALLLSPLLAALGFAQQIPCPINVNYTNTSTTASNQIDCTITATFDNATLSFLYNLPGGKLENYGTMNNDAGATLANNGATIHNFSGATISNLQLGEIDNAGKLVNNSGGTINNYGTLYNRPGGFSFAKVDNFGDFYNGGKIYNDDSASMLTNFGHVTNDGLIDNENGGTLSNSGGLQNGGTLNNGFGSLLNNRAGASLGNFGTLTNDVGGTLKNGGLLANQGTLDNYGALKIQSGGWLDNRGSLSNYDGGAINNKGSLTNSGAGITNFSGGTISNLKGGVLYNAGTIKNQAGADLENRGTLFNRPGGFDRSVINNYGDLHNSGKIYNDSYVSALNNFGHLLNSGFIDTENGGTISNRGRLGNHGTLYTAGGGTINNSGTLNNYGRLTNDVGGTLSNVGALTNNVGGTIYNYGTISNAYNDPTSLLDNKGTINDYGDVENVSRFFNEGGAVLNILAGASLHNAVSVDNWGLIDISGTLTSPGVLFTSGILKVRIEGTLHFDDHDPDDFFLSPVNYGTVEVNGQVYNGTGNVFHNFGTVNISRGGSIDSRGYYLQSSDVTVVDGVLSSMVYPVNIRGGKLMGTGTIFGSVGSDGTIAPGDSAGALTISGDYTQSELGTFELEILSGGFDQLSVGRKVSLDGTLDILLEQGFDPAVGTTYRFLLFAPGELSGTFASIQNDIFNSGTEKWIVNYDNSNGYVELQAYATPEPASLLLLGSGLLTLGYGVRRRLLN